MTWWGWVIAGAILLGAELSFVSAQFYLVFIGSAAILVGLATLGDEARLARLALVEPGLQIAFIDGDTRRRAVDHAVRASRDPLRRQPRDPQLSLVGPRAAGSGQVRGWLDLQEGRRQFGMGPNAMPCQRAALIRSLGRLTR